MDFLRADVGPAENLEPIGRAEKLEPTVTAVATGVASLGAGLDAHDYWSKMTIHELIKADVLFWLFTYGTITIIGCIHLYEYLKSISD